MMSNIRNYLMKKASSVVTFKDDRRLKHIASDALQLIDESDVRIAEKTGLSYATIKRLRSMNDSPTGRQYNPHVSTIEAVLETVGGRLEVMK